MPFDPDLTQRIPSDNAPAPEASGHAGTVIEVELRVVDSHKTAGLDELTDALEIVSSDPDPDNGGGVHRYKVWAEGELVAALRFQQGPRGQEGSRPGLTSQALVSILIDHFQSFQAGPYACRENALVITALEEAKGWMIKRVIDRKRRQVLGRLAQ